MIKLTHLRHDDSLSQASGSYKRRKTNSVKAVAHGPIFKKSGSKHFDNSTRTSTSPIQDGPAPATLSTSFKSELPQPKEEVRFALPEPQEQENYFGSSPVNGPQPANQSGIDSIDQPKTLQLSEEDEAKSYAPFLSALGLQIARGHDFISGTIIPRQGINGVDRENHSGDTTEEEDDEMIESRNGYPMIRSDIWLIHSPKANPSTFPIPFPSFQTHNLKMRFDAASADHHSSSLSNTS